MILTLPGVALLSTHVSIPDWPSWNQSSVFEGQSGVDTCHHGIKQKSFWLLFEGEKPAAWGGRLAVRDIFVRAEAGREVGESSRGGARRGDILSGAVKLTARGIAGGRDFWRRGGGFELKRLLRTREQGPPGFSRGSKEGNVMCMNGYFMKEAFLFNGDPSIVGIYSGFTSFSIPEALKQVTGRDSWAYAANMVGFRWHGLERIIRYILQGVNEERGICTVLRLIEIWDMAQ
ncbi:hypothetical protein CK203_004671 [Vitis vinifera]|uniref:Uncharacterized protein n=1 Tax=Vitis vinifera TaxID=29760 RepID=A0A438KFV2_VITVI|nr:hypothetical protein CK203_004671 [Vitis vinifera]